MLTFQSSLVVGRGARLIYGVCDDRLDYMIKGISPASFNRQRSGPTQGWDAFFSARVSRRPGWDYVSARAEGRFPQARAGVWYLASARHLSL